MDKIKIINSLQYWKKKKVAFVVGKIGIQTWVSNVDSPAQIEQSE